MQKAWAFPFPAGLTTLAPTFAKPGPALARLGWLKASRQFQALLVCDSVFRSAPNDLPARQVVASQSISGIWDTSSLLAASVRCP